MAYHLFFTGRYGLAIPVFLLGAIVFGGSCRENKQPVQSDSEVTAYIGATIIDGTGGEPVRDGIVVVRKGRFDMIGTAATTTIPEGAIIHDLKGKFIVPGIINGHGHVGETKGIEGGHYAKENILDNLRIYARYGVTTVVSLGGDREAAESVRQVKNTQQNDTTDDLHARLFIAGAIINGANPVAAAAAVDSNAHMGVDIMKIRVDDNLGTSPKMPEEVYRAVINRSHELGYKLAAHMYYLDDARKLLDAGADMLAHSIRDRAIPEEFVRVLSARRIPYCPTLTRELSTFVYSETPVFFADPFFTQEYTSATVAPLRDSARQMRMKESKAALTYKAQLVVAMANLKMLSDAGVPIVFGTDSGVPTRFMGYFEHVEMRMMQEAGLTPMKILVAASQTAAQQLGLKDLGTVTSGNWADFLVLDADPLQDIKNMQNIKAVFIGGKQVRRHGN